MPDRPVALVTGATRGLGSAIARALAPTHRLIIGGRSEEAVAKACAEYDDALGLVADLADEGATARALRGALARSGGLDVLVNNAGIGWKASIEDTSRDQWREILETNLIAIADLTRLCLPALRDSKGTVVMVNSGAGVRIYPGDAAYTVSKWALRSFTECLRESERGRIRVVSVHPGRIDTDMQVRMQMQAGRPYRPEEHMRAEDVAAAIRMAVDLPVSTNLDEIHMRTTEVKL